MSSRTVFISGAHTGLGLEIVKELCQSPNQYTIIMAGRSADKTNAAIEALKEGFPNSTSKLEAVPLDVESDESIQEATSIVEKNFGTIDVLINNAGASYEHGLAMGDTTYTHRQAFNKNWDVNVTGAHLLTHALVPSLLKSSRPYLLFITSGTCSLKESESEELYFNKVAPAGLPKAIGFTGYRSCKAGLNLVMREWYRMLKNDGAFVASISPGWLATGLGGIGAEKLKQMGAKDPALGGKLIREVIEGKRDADAGFVIREGGVQPW